MSVEVTTPQIIWHPPKFEKHCLNGTWLHPGMETVAISKTDLVQNGFSETAMTFFFSIKMGCLASPCLSCTQVSSNAVFQSELRTLPNSHHPELSAKKTKQKNSSFICWQNWLCLVEFSSQDLTGWVPMVSFNMVLCLSVSYKLVDWHRSSNRLRLAILAGILHRYVRLH